MPGGRGYRSRTRDLFARAYKTNGYIPLTTYLRNFKIGDYVDIKASSRSASPFGKDGGTSRAIPPPSSASNPQVNGAIHKGMPHKVYQGRTGIIWNVTKRAVGVEINKQVGNRILKKRIHVRVEHVQPSRCREDFLKRVKENDAAKKEAKAKGQKAVTKRQPVGPRAAFTLTNATMETVTPIPYGESHAGGSQRLISGSLGLPRRHRVSREGHSLGRACAHPPHLFPCLPRLADIVKEGLLA